MAEKYIRKSAWENNGGWDNTDIYWYARAVLEMRKIPLAEHSSWGFFGAIHGINDTWRNLEDFPEFKNIDIDALNKKYTEDGYWNQCQHGTWYFLPWHRGYLLGLESILRHIVVSLKGPENWALPYWDYNDPQHLDEDKNILLPPAFITKEFPIDKNTIVANPLYISQRYASNPNNPTYISQDTSNSINLKALEVSGFTFDNPVSPSFGGGKTTFDHGGSSTGSLESMPHNIMHILIGGSDGTTYGLMTDPDLAALDPIFYMHHANIDRLWNVWLKHGHTNPIDNEWLNGPTNGIFKVPTAFNDPWVYHANDVQDSSKLVINGNDVSYEYTKGSGDNLLNLIKDQIQIRAKKFALQSWTQGEHDIEIIGATRTQLNISRPTDISIQLDKVGNDNVLKSRILTSLKNSILPNKFYLYIEGIKGNHEGITLNIQTQSNKNLYSVALFGLSTASGLNDKHNGEGMNISLDITDYIDDLYLTTELQNIDDLNLKLEPVGLQAGSTLTIERISVHKDL